MRELLFAIATIAAALVVVAAAVFGAHDADTLVSPPEAVAEDFGRELAMARYTLSRKYLSAEQRRQQSANDLKARFEPWRARIGKFDAAEARELSREGDRSSAACELQGDRSTVSLSVLLVRQHGLWRVERWEAAAEATR